MHYWGNVHARIRHLFSNRGFGPAMRILTVLSPFFSSEIDCFIVNYNGNACILGLNGWACWATAITNRTYTPTSLSSPSSPAYDLPSSKSSILPLHGRRTRHRTQTNILNDLTVSIMTAIIRHIFAGLAQTFVQCITDQ